MHIALDGQGPLHDQVTRALRDAVFEGRLASGSRLPPTRQLADDLGISRNTVLSAYEQLRAEGIIEARVGSGSYVAPRSSGPDVQAVQVGDIEAQSAYSARSRACLGAQRFVRMSAQPPLFEFRYGIPSTNLALTQAWARELSQAALYTKPDYPRARGLRALREQVCLYLGRRRGIKADPDDVLIVSGTQQAMALTARVLVDCGIEVAIEDPQYWSVRMVLQAHGANLVPIPVDAEGMRVDCLPQSPPKLVCVSPSHQFPLGAVLSHPRRLALLEYAGRHGAWIFEDDYDSEFRYDSRPLAPLRALDAAHRVIYVGTFSKVMFPALRLAYMVVPAHLRADFAAAKWLDDSGAPSVEQLALANFMGNGGFDRHLRHTCKELRKRRAALIAGLRRVRSGYLDIEDSHAGMHLVAWLAGRSESECAALVAIAATRGLGLSSISKYYINPPERSGLLLGYAALSVPEIADAVALLELCLEDAFGRH